MNIQAEKNVPELRFPEFSEEWQPINLEKHLLEHKERVSHDTEFPVLTSSREGLFLQKDYYSDREVINDGEYGVVPYGYFTYRHMSDDLTFKFNINFIAPKGAISKEYPVFKTKNLNSYFLRELLNNTNSFKKFAIQQKKGGTRTRLYFRVLKTFSPLTPKEEEQQKIADFLAAMDEKITALREKKEALTNYKKGVMQQLFSGELRFKQGDGTSYPAWEHVQASQLFENYSNKQHNGNLPILAASQEKGMVYRDEIDIDIKASKTSVLSYKVVEPGCFVISLRSFQGGLEYAEVKGICSPAYTILKPLKPINDYFYKAYFKKEDFIKKLSNTVIGIRDGKQISYSAFSEMKLPYPPSIDEQDKIANFLSSLDEKIEAVEATLMQAETFKKGLLQKMFV